LTVAALALPQSMAYAVIAGIHSKYGLYTAIVPVIISSLLGSSKFLISGPTNAISMLVFSALSAVTIDGTLAISLPESERVAIVLAIAVIAGGLQLAMSLARMGSLITFISHDDLEAAYKEVVASTYGPRAVFYARSKGYSHNNVIIMAVLYVVMIESKASGVAYTVDPNNPDERNS
jgi:hypothetical protein